MKSKQSKTAIALLILVNFGSTFCVPVGNLTPTNANSLYDATPTPTNTIITVESTYKTTTVQSDTTPTTTEHELQRDSSTSKTTTVQSDIAPTTTEHELQRDSSTSKTTEPLITTLNNTSSSTLTRLVPTTLSPPDKNEELMFVIIFYLCFIGIPVLIILTIILIHKGCCNKK